MRDVVLLICMNSYLVERVASTFTTSIHLHTFIVYKTRECSGDAAYVRRTRMSIHYWNLQQTSKIHLLAHISEPACYA